MAQSKDSRPARQNYWSRRTLKKRKIKNLVECNNMTEKQATDFWGNTRKLRIKI